MEKEKISFNQKFIVRMVLSFAVYMIIGWAIQRRLLEDYRFMAQQSLVKQSVNGYLRGVAGSLGVAAAINVIWWWLALNTNGIRQLFERNAILCAAILGTVLFIIILIIKARYGNVVDDLGNENSLCYAYCAGCGFLINVFGFPPQTIQDVLLPGGRWGRLIAVIVVVALAVVILI